MLHPDEKTGINPFLIPALSVWGVPARYRELQPLRLGDYAPFPTHPLPKMSQQDLSGMATRGELWKWKGREEKQWELGILSVK